jgi:hypothetical protein
MAVLVVAEHKVVSRVLYEAHIAARVGTAINGSVVLVLYAYSFFSVGD